MGTRVTALAASVAVAAAGVAGIASVAGADGGGRRLSTDLNGAEEFPGPGDANATGLADLRLNQGQGEICFDLSWADIDGTVFAAHIHVGAAGDAGPIVVPLFMGSFSGTDAVSDCVDVDAELVKAIRQHPSAYYVNVHSTPSFPAGAVRGQLGD